MGGQSNLAPPPKTSVTIHLNPTAPLAERVLLPGDPGRALRLAQALLDSPRMFNHNRGLWGYTGNSADDRPLTIQSTGMGGPSAAIVIAELAELGARRRVRVGTCGALAPQLALGDLVIVHDAIPQDGASTALGARDALAPDPELAHALLGAAGGGARSGSVVSTDLFYDLPDGAVEAWTAAGALAVEMETATLFALARRRGLKAASLLAVSDVSSPARARIGSEELVAAELRLGEIAAGALSRLGDEP
jgi:DeoD family purine-nucleoside phosphorylase